MKTTEGIILKINGYGLENDNDLDCEPIKGSGILEEHFSNEYGDIDIKAEDLYVKSDTWKIIQISADFWGLVYTLIQE